VPQLPLIACRVAIDRYLLPAGPAAANPYQRRAAAGWDGRTDTRQFNRSYITALRGSANNLYSAEIMKESEGLASG